jgi:hypothetical protein
MHDRQGGYAWLYTNHVGVRWTMGKMLMLGYAPKLRRDCIHVTSYFFYDVP